MRPHKTTMFDLSCVPLSSAYVRAVLARTWTGQHLGGWEQ